ncbi:MAG: HlyD family efflux transporter periplasmic adaptor subunit [Bacteroidetes bacterium]|nr:HlyD family efflux transporter periplasmic adaptor subunit [Bacteroidota bacterium]
MAENHDIWERGKEVEELLGRQPAWITRWGIALFALFLTLLITGCWIIRYPDILVSPVMVTSENPPAGLVSRADGKISALYVKDRQLVNSGDILLQIENPARYEDVKVLENILNGFTPDSSKLAAFSLFPGERSWILGDIQTSFTGFRKSLNEYSQFLVMKEFAKKVKAMKEEEKMTNAYVDRLRIQSQVLEKDLKLGNKQYSRDSALFAQKVIAPVDFEKSESSYLQKKFSLEGTRVTLANTRIQLSQLQKDIIDLSLQYQRAKDELIQAVEKGYQELRNQVLLWKQTYLLISPVSGQVTFNQYWTLYQPVKKGEKVLTVVPPGKTRIIGKVSLTLEGAGKVKPGQRVNIKFSGYPYLEYGTVKGFVINKSLTSQDNHYTIEVSFPEGLKTSYGKQLDYQPEMMGTAEIVTEDVRLLERIINPIRYLINRNR